MTSSQIDFALEMVKLAGLSILPFTAYLSWKKIGQKVSATYVWGGGLFYEDGISSITLENAKDRPLVVYAAHAVMGNLCFDIGNFDPPIIIKPMETAVIKVEKVSSRAIKGERIWWQLPQRPRNIDIYLSAQGKLIKCKRGSRPDIQVVVDKKNLKRVSNFVKKYNDLIYNDDAKFAIIYNAGDGTAKTALITRTGIIDWPFIPKQIDPSNLRDERTVHLAVERMGLDPLIAPYSVQRLP